MADSSTITTGFLDHPIFRIVSEVAESLGVRAFVIGGYVRDCFLGRINDDIDIVVEGSGLALAEAVAEYVTRTEKKKCFATLFKNFGTAMIKYHGAEIEFVGARKESYNRNSRKPIVENGTLEEDQLRRDFTINAMAFSLQKEDFGALVDPFGGIRDLAAGIIRTPLDPDTTYSDDPLRMLRAIRFACKLSTDDIQFEIVPESIESMLRMGPRMEILSKERITEELDKMLLTAKPSKAFRLLERTGLLAYVLPQLQQLSVVQVQDGKGHKDNFSHTLQVLDNVCALERETGREPSLYLRWAALLHDIGKPVSKRFDPAIGWTFHGHDVVGARMVSKIFKSLKMPLDEMKYVEKLVGLHMRPIALVDDEVTDSAVRRLLFDAGDDIDDLMLLCSADITSKNPEKVARVKHNFELVKTKLVDVEQRDQVRNFKNPITGELIMEVYGVPPGRIIGTIKNQIKEDILDGIIPNDYNAAYERMKQLAAENGLQEK